MAESECVRVFCRFRPFNKREIALGADQALKIDIKADSITITDPTDGKARDFPFDYAFNTDTTQDLVFEKCASISVNDVMEGYNGTIFAYGQTGGETTKSARRPPSLAGFCLQHAWLAWSICLVLIRWIFVCGLWAQ